MKVKELKRRLRNFDDNDDVVISAHREGGVIGDMCVDLYNLYRGFDHYNNRVMLYPNELLAVRDPASLNQKESSKQ